MEVKDRARKHGAFVKKGFDREKALEELRAGGKLTRGELVRCRMRYFTDGMVLGSREFVEGVFRENRECFGPKRESGARGLPLEVDEGEVLYTLRDFGVKALE